MRALLTIAALSLSASALAQDAAEPATPTSVVAAANAGEWLAIAPDDLLVMELAPDAAGNPRTVIIQLMPPPFSQPWVENIRALAAAHWWDGTSVNRVQDNYVTQWGDVTEAKPLPQGVVSPHRDYAVEGRDFPLVELGNLVSRGRWAGRGGPPPPAPFDMEWDVYAPLVGFGHGWPFAYGRKSLPANCDANDAPTNCSDLSLSPDENQMWPVHCYGAVGVGRNMAPDTGTGAELYTIIGQPQRHMDRNLAVVGRVIEGMEHLSSLPRGHGDLGFYTEEEAHLRTPILSVRLGSETAEPPRFEYLDTASESFARYVAVRANRNDAFYTVPAGGVDICSVQVPIRRVEP